MRILFILALFIASSASVPALGLEVAHPESRPFAKSADVKTEVDAALVRALRDDKLVILVMGANWCHDSRGLAGWFNTPRFAKMLNSKFELVYIDVGKPQRGKGRNLAIAERFGIKSQENTPMVLVLSPDGKRLNSEEDAKSWRNAASRDEGDIFSYFDAFAPEL